MALVLMVCVPWVHGVGFNYVGFFQGFYSETMNVA